MTAPHSVGSAVADAHRRDWGVVLATTARLTRNLDLAEECVQEAYAQALESWPTTGIPSNPAAWLTVAARRRAVDALRRHARLTPKLQLLVASSDDEQFSDDNAPVEDQRLGLLSMCCHPALNVEAQVALTLRLVCGVPTADIARALLVSEPTMSARLTRAKRKIAISVIPMRVPAINDWPERQDGILGVVFLLFTMSHTSQTGSELVRVDMVEEAFRLIRVLRMLLPGDNEVRGLLALFLAIDARRASRLDEFGIPVLLAQQDRTKWDRAAITEARDLLSSNSSSGPKGRFELQAEIALCHADVETDGPTNWNRIRELYDELLAVWPSPTALLSRAVATSMIKGPEEALAEVDQVERDSRMATYPYLPKLKADLLTQLNRRGEAAVELSKAISLTSNEVERAQMKRMLDERLDTQSAPVRL
ncbi:MAG: RNA polymerase sigma factor [Acidimicrobiales bacterium]